MTKSQLGGPENPSSTVWMWISHCLDQSTVIFMESAIWNKQKAMCRLGLALSPPVVFHQSVNSFQSAWALMSAASLTWLNSVKPYFLNQSLVIGHVIFQIWWWKIWRNCLNLFWKINSKLKLFCKKRVKASSCISKKSLDMIHSIKGFGKILHLMPIQGHFKDSINFKIMLSNWYINWWE